VNAGRVTLRLGRGTERASEHALREHRLEGIRDAVDDFVYALGLLMAGQDPPGEVADDSLLARLRDQLGPFLVRGDVMRPDFGAFGDLRVEGDLLQGADSILATLEFDDHCLRQTVAGRLTPARRRRLRLAMHVAIDPARIIDCAVSEVIERGG
jgi:hypothetical protein